MISKKLLIIIAGLILVLVIYFFSGSSNNASEYITHGNGTTTLQASLPTLEKTFEQMRSNAGWDTSKPLVWGYYFYDNDSKKLATFGEKLKTDGFKIYKVRESAAKNDDSYLLYIYEERIHTPGSLLDQCNKLGKLTIQNNIDIFDGWEAGKEPL